MSDRRATAARRAIPLLLSLALALLTLAGIGEARRLLPNGELVQSLTETLSLPGAILASLFIPGGLHSGRAGTWALLTILGNTAFYTLLWYVAVRVLGLQRVVTFLSTRGEGGGAR